MSPDARDPDEFYIGYEDDTPPGIGRRLHDLLVAVAAAAVAVAVVVLMAHPRLEPARFDFGRPQAVTGVLRRAPYPSLVVDRDRVWLSGQGKHGADAAVAGVPEGPVTLHGALISRGVHRMFEIVPGSPVAASTRQPRAPAAATGGTEVALTGEIVDAKCFLGVMNPGEGTVHRDCARMCLLGGLPPALLVRGGRGEEALVLLVSASGDPIGRALADIAGLPVRVRGRLGRENGHLVLRADRSQFQLDAPGP